MKTIINLLATIWFGKEYMNLKKFYESEVAHGEKMPWKEWYKAMIEDLDGQCLR